MGKRGTTRTHTAMVAAAAAVFRQDLCYHPEFRSSTKHYKIGETTLESHNKSNGQHGINIATIGGSSAEHQKNEENPEKQGINIGLGTMLT